MVDNKKSGDTLEPGEAANTVVSLSQVLLAPLDAIFKAQVHAGRSFLNFVLQLSYKPEPPKDGAPGAAAAAVKGNQPDEIFSVDFVQRVPAPPVAGNAEGATRLQKVSVPVLALVPLQPLSIQEAQVDLAMEVTYIGAHRQMRQKERKEAADPPPWYLVDDPISLRGHVAPASGSAPSDKPLIHVSVKVATVATPSGLEKLLTTLTQSSQVTNIEPDKS